MDSFTGSGPEPVFGLGVKYKKAQHGISSCPYDSLKSNGDVGIEVASKYIGKCAEPCIQQGPVKSVIYSSDDDSDVEFSSMSLVGLAAKHKNNKPLTLGKTPISESTLDFPYNIQKSRLVDSSDSSSESEGTLFSLMRKCKVEETLPCVSDKVKNQYSRYHFNQFSAKESVDLKHGKMNDQFCKQTQDFAAEVIKTEFVAANFSDDSDSDEHLSLLELRLKHAASVNHEDSGSAEDIRSCKPSIKELQNLTNYHRHHTKSESDRFSSSAVHLSDNLLKKSFENTLSTSLRSLRGGGHQDMGLKFSPGGSIPGSFKSLNASNSLNSSLASVGFEASKLGSHTDICYTHSDPDVSIALANYDHKFGRRQEQGVGHFAVDTVDGGINLSCALKESARERTSESMMSENSVEILDNVEDEEIVTLLDSLMVDEETGDEEKAKKRLLSCSELDESCMTDISHVLKVKVKLRTRKCSSFGKVVCRKWKSLRTPYVRKDKQETNVVPFDFVEPSPDDIITYALKRRL